MLQGSCLCGGVRYEYDGEITELSMCHCSQCRRAQGTAFVAVGPIQTDRFRLLAGAGLLKEYRAVPHKARVFCSHCGSPLYSRRDDLPEVLRLRLGTVTTPFTCANAYHQHVASKASWFTITDDLPHYPEGKPA
ncbi:MAG TPA: GFA family protein [Moraxellaceae bacterium]|nr:GFA family protein [Moraxellaceae bacterium]